MRRTNKYKLPLLRDLVWMMQACQAWGKILISVGHFCVSVCSKWNYLTHFNLSYETLKVEGNVQLAANNFLTIFQAEKCNQCKWAHISRYHRTQLKITMLLHSYVIFIWIQKKHNANKSANLFTFVKWGVKCNSIENNDCTPKSRKMSRMTIKNFFGILVKKNPHNWMHSKREVKTNIGIKSATF